MPDGARWQGGLLCGGVVVVADDAGDFPGAVFVLPQMNELALANPLGVFMAGVMETVDAGFQGAVALHVKDLKSSGNEFAGGFAADVFLDAVGQCGFAEGDAALIVIKLDVVDEERGELLQITFVVGIEKRGIERGDSLVEFRLGFDVFEGWDGLGLCLDNEYGEKGQEQDDS